MFSTLKEYAASAQGKMTDTYAGYMAKDELEKVLVEATANENWNISNSKLLQIADATYNMNNVERVCNFLNLKLESQGPQWRRILKSLAAIEFVIKNGSPQAVIQFKRDMYKISSLTSFSYHENGKDQGNCVREKCNLVIDMLSAEQRLYQERGEAYEYRKKFYPGAGPTAEQAGVTNPAAVFSGSFTGGSYGGGPTSMPAAGGIPTSYSQPNQSYNQGFGSQDPGIAAASMGSHGLGSSQSKTYNPYGSDAQGGQPGMGMGGIGAQSMGSNSMPGMSMGSSTTNTTQQSYLQKTATIVETMKSTVVDSAGAVGSAMGLKPNKKGILGNPNEFLGSMQNQYAVNYAPPTSMSSSQSSSTTHHTSIQNYSSSTQQTSSSFKSGGGPWGGAPAPVQNIQPASATPAKAAPVAPPKEAKAKQMRQVDTESSDDDYGQEFVQPKTRSQKQAALSGQAQPAPVQQQAPAPKAKPQHVPVPVPQVDLLDMGGPTPAAPAQPVQQTSAFNFMGGAPAQPAPQTQQVDLLNMGGAPTVSSQPAAQPNVLDLLSGPSQPQQPQVAQAPTALFSGMNLNSGAAQQQPAPQASSGFDFMSSAPVSATPQVPQYSQQPTVDPFAAPKAEPVAVKEPERYVPKNKNSEDAWVKGAQFIDLVGLGRNDEAKAAKSNAVYIDIKPNAAAAAQQQQNVGSTGFQPMAHLNEQQQQQLRLQQMQAQFMQNQNPAGAAGQPGGAAKGGSSAFGFM